MVERVIWFPDMGGDIAEGGLVEKIFDGVFFARRGVGGEAKVLEKQATAFLVIVVFII